MLLSARSRLRTKPSKAEGPCLTTSQGLPARAVGHHLSCSGHGPSTHPMLGELAWEERLKGFSGLSHGRGVGVGVPR